MIICAGLNGFEENKDIEDYGLAAYSVNTGEVFYAEARETSK